MRILFLPSWRNLWLSSGVLSISLLGDALLYVVLPVNDHLFGVSMIWVGILLAVNRVIRTFTYGWIALLGEQIGLKNLCIISAITAILSTFGYSLFSGPIPLALARILWGLSYAGLLLVTLAYAVEDRSKAGIRIGFSRAVEQIGPLVALTFGTWLAGQVGPKNVFSYLAYASLLCLPFAFALKNPSRKPPSAKRKKKTNVFSQPNSFDFLIFLMGLAIDGIFTVTISLMWLNHVTPETAIILGGLVLTGRRLMEMMTAPLAGIISDTFGVQKPLIFASILAICGLFFVGYGWLIIGSVFIIVARGALGTLFPTAVSLLKEGSALENLARNQTWRDIGAAVGPFGTGFLLIIASPMLIHTSLSIGFALSFIWLINSSSWREIRKNKL
ncbi:MAG: hypothetical protein O3A15_01930 [Proteobacteria bacterium]|nr:hypothetical protein [Pseudomonadota bacterium]